ncbi:Talin-2 [Eumeta japonica]|uniref:Talin-2 n=1 Tax=Eumeta variegata TaxID=151549 RepID=A0A4C1STY1_EUMVA|nr:Talin-2 [Eumeta japonica]
MLELTEAGSVPEDRNLLPPTVTPRPRRVSRPVFDVASRCLEVCRAVCDEMAPLALKISMDNGAIVKTVKFDTSTKVLEAHRIVEEKILDGTSGEIKKGFHSAQLEANALSRYLPRPDYGLFLTSTEGQSSGIWLESDKALEYYMLRDGDTLLYLNRIGNLRVRMLDGTVKTIEVDESIPIANLMLFICSKIGIMNYDEYGLCWEEKEETEDSKSNTGTLTLKRKPQEKERERDAKMEQLRKKLKTDDEVKWLDATKSLRELSVQPGETVLLKRRLFYSDRNVDSRDPVQLNLLYVEARDAILSGKHPITESMACRFAGIQCHIQLGDHKEDKHTPHIIEPKEFLPMGYSKSRGIKKKILQEHAKHVGVNELEAKTLYVRTARSLHTYGVSFFLVKEKQKDKNRLVPRLLGINAESIQRLDENTKETLVVWPLTHVQRWKANDTTFTLDFGEYRSLNLVDCSNDKQYACQTSEARRIENVLKSYIDLILKKKKAKDYFGKYGSDSEPMAVDVVGASKRYSLLTLALACDRLYYAHAFECHPFTLALSLCIPPPQER